MLPYGFKNYRLLATEIGGRAPAPVDEDQATLTIGVYNVENLDPKIEDADLVGDPDADIDDMPLVDGPEEIVGLLAIASLGL